MEYTDRCVVRPLARHPIGVASIVRRDVLLERSVIEVAMKPGVSKHIGDDCMSISYDEFVLRTFPHRSVITKGAAILQTNRSPRCVTMLYAIDGGIQLLGVFKNIGTVSNTE